jgi:hypothetical protein
VESVRVEEAAAVVVVIAADVVLAELDAADGSALPTDSHHRHAPRGYFAD